MCTGGWLWWPSGTMSMPLHKKKKIKKGTAFKIVIRGFSVRPISVLFVLRLQLCQVFHYFGWITRLLESAHPCLSLIQAISMTVPAISCEGVNIILHSFCLCCSRQNGCRPPTPPPRHATMCDWLIRNWYQRDNGCLVLCLSLIQRFCHCLLHKLLHQHVRRLCHLLHCGIHGQRHKKTHCRCGSLR